MKQVSGGRTQGHDFFNESNTVNEPAIDHYRHRRRFFAVQPKRVEISRGHGNVFGSRDGEMLIDTHIRDLIDAIPTRAYLQFCRHDSLRCNKSDHAAVFAGVREGTNAVLIDRYEFCLYRNITDNGFEFQQLPSSELLRSADAIMDLRLRGSAFPPASSVTLYCQVVPCFVGISGALQTETMA